jgi:hypothetical protein
MSIIDFRALFVPDFLMIAIIAIRLLTQFSFMVQMKLMYCLVNYFITTIQLIKRTRQLQYKDHA